MSSIFFAAPLFLALSLQSPSPPHPQRQLSPVDQMLAQATEALRAGRLIDAQRLTETALKEAEKGPNNPELGKVMGNLAGLYFQKGDTAQAIALAGRALTADQKAFGSDSSRVAGDLLNLATFCQMAGKLDEAEQDLKRAIAILDQDPNRDPWLRIATLGDLAEFYLGQKRYPEAELLARRALELAEAAPHRAVTEILGRRRFLAEVYQQEGKDEFEIERLLAGTGPDTASPRNAALVETLKAMNLADHYRDQGSLQLAEENYSLAIVDLERTQSPGSGALLSGCLDGLAAIYEKEHRVTEAEDAFERAVALREQAASSPNPDVPLRTRKLAQEMSARNLSFVGGLLDHYRQQGRLSEIEPVFLRALEIQETVLGPDDEAVAETASGLAGVYCEEEKYEEALPLYERTLAIQEKNLGPGHQNLATTLQQYAGALRALGEDAEAKAASARADAILNQKSHETR